MGENTYTRTRTILKNDDFEQMQQTLAFKYNCKNAIQLNVLIGCERSGIVRDSFAKLGCKSYSCDLVAATGNHFQQDIAEVIPTQRWHLIGLHPNCRKVCSSGNHVYAKEKLNERISDAKWIYDLWELAKTHAVCVYLENSIGVLPSLTMLGPATQIIQPHQFGHDASKSTALWLHNLPPLKPTKHVKPRYIDGLPRWANQTDSGQNKLAPTANRSQLRARTYPGIANAMAEQWLNWVQFQVDTAPESDKT